MTPLPLEPTGNHPIVQTIKQIIRILREQRIVADPSIQIERTSNGVRVKARGGSSASGPSKDKPVWL